MPRHHARHAFLALALAFAAPAALAQEPTVPADPPPAGSPDVVPERIEPQRPIGPPPEESLTDRLERTDGVIRPPPAVDPEMVEPPPDGGAAVGPVIKPPSPPDP